MRSFVLKWGLSMKRKHRWLVLAISLLLSGLIVYGMYRLQGQYIRSEQTVPIYVANQWLQAGHIITSTDLKQVQYPLSLVTEDMLIHSDELINKELVIPLGKEEPFISWKLNTFHLLPKLDEATFQIPVTYIKSVANDIRAGDYVYIYASGHDVASNKLFNEPVKVAAVKTSTNTEVESVAINDVGSTLDSNSFELYQHRRKASGVIEYINLNLTEPQWLAIDELCKDGNAQLIVAFTPYFVELKL